jgi:hypothetical protein
MSNEIFLLGFVCIFHLVGGIGLGAVVRSVLARDFTCQTLFLLVWGTMMGVMPLTFGADAFLSPNPLLFALEVAFLLGVIIVSALFPMDYFNAFSAGNPLLAGFGTIMMFAGGALILALRRQSPVEAFALGGALILIGALGFGVGLLRVVRAVEADATKFTEPKASPTPRRRRRSKRSSGLG